MSNNNESPAYTTYTIHNKIAENKTRAQLQADSDLIAQQTAEFLANGGNVVAIDSKEQKEYIDHIDYDYMDADIDKQSYIMQLKQQLQ